MRHCFFNSAESDKSVVVFPEPGEDIKLIKKVLDFFNDLQLFYTHREDQNNSYDSGLMLGANLE